MDFHTSEDKIRQIIADQLGYPVEKVLQLSNLKRDLNAGDLDMVEIAMALEDEFHIELKEEVCEKIHSVFGFVHAVQNILRSKN
jgi:acyl carrier protein